MKTRFPIMGQVCWILAITLQVVSIPSSATTQASAEPADPAAGPVDGEAGWNDPQRPGLPRQDPPPDTIGGDDKLILSTPAIAVNHAYSMDIAENGDIYGAFEASDAVTGAEVRIYRSRDGGDTWSLWGTRSDADPARNYHQPSIHVAEGDEDRLYLAYQYENGAADRVINVVYSSLDLPAADFIVHTAMSQAGIDFKFPDISSDEVNFNAYFLYLVAQADDGNGDDIWFTRSTDFGASWEAEYAIATVGAGDRDYLWPHVRYGFAGVVHCVWQFTIDLDSDSAIRYRRALNRAAAGVADWQPVVMLTSTTDGRRDDYPSVAASHASPKVLVGHLDIPAGGISESQLRLSPDGGATWPNASTADLPIGAYGPELLAMPAGQGFRIAGYVGDGLLGAYVTSESAPLTLSAEMVFTDHQYYGDQVSNPAVCFDYDASRGNRIGWMWTLLEDSSDRLYFDAQWRADPGYPNLEPGFPLALASGAVAHPALVDVDADADLEIVFGDAAGCIQILNPDGTTVPGWPVDIGDFPPTYPLPGGSPIANCAVAVADLDGDERPEVVAGNSAGQVFAYNRDGALLPGWPVDLGVGQEVFVSIGHIADISRRQIAACAGLELHVLLHDGTEAPGFPVAVAGTLTAPAAIGDVDGNGEPDLIVIGSDRLNWFDGAGDWHFQSILAAESYSGQAALGDLDLDGDLEIVASSSAGRLRAIHHTGDAVFPIVSDPSQSHLTSPALANVIGTFEPDVAFAARQWTVHLLLSNGSEIEGWPHSTTANYFLLGAPTMETLDEASGDVVIGSRDGSGYAWNNLFTNVPGWPKALEGQCNVSPASDDIDQDGRVEVVFLTSTHLIVLDTGARLIRSDPRGQWPMYGCNPARTGCLDCPEDLSAEAPDVEPASQAALRLTAAVPSHSSIGLTFRITAAAPVRIGVFDASGRLVRELLRTELGTGEYDIVWDGRDARGEAAASGTYFCQLQAGSLQSLVRVLLVR